MATMSISMSMGTPLSLAPPRSLGTGGAPTRSYSDTSADNAEQPRPRKGKRNSKVIQVNIQSMLSKSVKAVGLLCTMSIAEIKFKIQCSFRTTLFFLIKKGRHNSIQIKIALPCQKKIIYYIYYHHRKHIFYKYMQLYFPLYF